MHPLIVIPARFGSTRIPGKPLSKINDKPLIELVVRRVQEFGLNANVVLATDDSRIADAASVTGVRAVLTSSRPRSGTERVAEVISRPEFSDANPILNVQGDQLSLPKQAAVGALEQLEMGFSIGTAAARLDEQHEIDRNRVKVAVDQGGCALSFSREMPENLTESERMRGVFLHLGVYAYTRGVLLDWVDLPPTEAEFEEGLEQLRPFLNGFPIGVALLDEAVEPGIDTFEDLAHVQKSNHLTRTTA